MLSILVYLLLLFHHISRFSVVSISYGPGFVHSTDIVVELFLELVRWK